MSDLDEKLLHATQGKNSDQLFRLANRLLARSKIVWMRGHERDNQGLRNRGWELRYLADGIRELVIRTNIIEIWDSKDDHANSLKNEKVRALIMKAMPILDGQPMKGQEMEILGDTGI